MKQLLFRSIASLLTYALLLSPRTSAYEFPLTDRSVREAYFLGQRHDEKMTAFFAQYLRRPPLPDKGPYISEIELQTPYAQVVAHSERNSVGYSAQQAAEDYKRRGDTILVRVRIEFTPTYNVIINAPQEEGSVAKQGIDVRTENFWKEFRYGLSQRDQWINLHEMRAEPIYVRPSAGAFSHLTGADVWLECDAKNVESVDTSVEVFTPGGQHVVVAFDLSRLR